MSGQAPLAAGAAPAEAGAAGPDFVLAYRLEEADALAWERRDPAQRRRDRVTLGGALFAGIGLLSVTARHMPDWLSRLHSNALALVILCLPLLAALAFRRFDLRRRARAALPGPVEVRLEVWARRLVEHRSDRDAPLALGAQALRGVVATAGHVFLFSKAGRVIVPAGAFADRAARDAFAARWRALCG